MSEKILTDIYPHDSGGFPLTSLPLTSRKGNGPPLRGSAIPGISVSPLHRLLEVNWNDNYTHRASARRLRRQFISSGLVMTRKILFMCTAIYVAYTVVVIFI